jgi:hypothetical protein
MFYLPNRNAQKWKKWTLNLRQISWLIKRARPKRTQRLNDLSFRAASNNNSSSSFQQVNMKRCHLLQHLRAWYLTYITFQQHLPNRATSRNRCLEDLVKFWRWSQIKITLQLVQVPTSQLSRAKQLFIWIALKVTRVRRSGQLQAQCCRKMLKLPRLLLNGWSLL